jgi:hypothetical protein
MSQAGFEPANPRLRLRGHRMIWLELNKIGLIVNTGVAYQIISYLVSVSQNLGNN